MRAHDEYTRKTGRPAPGPARSTAGDSPADRIHALQRVLGNAAVSELIERQTVTVHRVLNSSGKPLDEPVRQDMEARLGADFSSVRVHDDAAARSSAEEIGARAYTSGEHVVIGSGGADRHTMAHELTHVVQQRSGPVEGTDNGTGLSISDPADRFERAAESVAAQAMSGGSVSTQDTAARPTPGAVQRALTVNTNNLTQQAKSGNDGPANEIWDQLAALPAFATRSPKDQSAMQDQFWKWVRDQKGQPGPKSHPIWGRKSQDRVYDNVVNLELALHGWVAAKPARHEEKEYAQQIIASPEVEVRLNSILYRVRTMIDELEDSDDAQIQARKPRILEQLNKVWHSGPAIGRNEIVERRLGWYEYNFEYLSEKLRRPEIATRITKGVLDVLNNPEDYEFRDKIVVIHDLTDYFGAPQQHNPKSKGRRLLSSPEDNLVLSTSGFAEGVRQTTPSRGRTPHQGTRDEQSPVTTFARSRGIPIWSGTSHTAARMLNFANWVSATDGELTALAHSIFAFWRVQYDHTSLAPHTLHEVMDVAQNFGIPYDPDDRYANLGHQEIAAEQNDLRDDVVNRWNALEARLSPHKDIPEVDELLETWDSALGYVEDQLEKFDKIDVAKRTAGLKNALRYLARFHLNLNHVVRNLPDSSSE